jgi:hypothetical protein
LDEHEAKVDWENDEWDTKWRDLWKEELRLSGPEYYAAQEPYLDNQWEASKIAR